MVGVARNLSIFLIDDEMADVELTMLALADVQQPLDVRTCAGGACPGNDEVMRTFETPGTVLPDVILLDIQMPPQSGLDILDVLKADARYAHIPVVVLSNSEEPRDVAEAYRRHAAGYLVKALRFGAFCEQLRTVMAFWQACRLV